MHAYMCMKFLLVSTYFPVKHISRRSTIISGPGNLFDTGLLNHVRIFLCGNSFSKNSTMPRIELKQAFLHLTAHIDKRYLSCFYTLNLPQCGIGYLRLLLDM